MTFCYIILGISLWILGSLGTTWCFGYMLPGGWDSGIDEISGYIFLILLWPIMLFLTPLILISMEVMKIWDSISLSPLILRFNPLRLWDETVKHGAKIRISKKGKLL